MGSFRKSLQLTFNQAPQIENLCVHILIFIQKFLQRILKVLSLLKTYAYLSKYVNTLR